MTPQAKEQRTPETASLSKCTIIVVNQYNEICIAKMLPALAEKKDVIKCNCTLTIHPAHAGSRPHLGNFAK
jgi:hypothetical protein